MPEIQELYPEADGDEDFQFLVNCDHTITPEVLSAFQMRFTFRGPYRRTDMSPTTWADYTESPQVMITDLRRKIVQCTVTGHTILPSGEYRGILRKTDPNARANLARWRLQIRSEHAF